MSASHVQALTQRRNGAKAGQMERRRASRTSKVLAERNQAVVSVGAWVEDGQDFLEHPADLALLTEELQADKRRADEESLRRFQDGVRRRLARRSHLSKARHQKATPDRRIPHYQVRTHQVSVGEDQISAEGAAQRSRSSPERLDSHERFGKCFTRTPFLLEPAASDCKTAALAPKLQPLPQWSHVRKSLHLPSREATRQVRLRLAACRLIQQDEAASDLPGGSWNVSPTRHRNNFHMLRPGEDVLEEEEQETTDAPFFYSHHECPLVQQKVGVHELWDPEKSHSDPGSTSDFKVSQVLWPLPDHEKVKQQRQSEFLLQRRQAMSTEREQVKENNRLRKHLKRTARIKAEKEKVRLEEEVRLEQAQQLANIKRKLEERELLILERLKLEEEERERSVQLQRRRREEKEKDTARFVEALRARMKERLSQLKLEPPPLCCCASSFWDSHPDTCANNCVFHNNPKEYSKALHSTMMSLDLL